MKIISLLFLTLFLGKGCNEETQNDIKTAVIEYTANTRGYYQQITVKDQMVTISKEREGKDKPVATKISDSDWKDLIDAFKDVNLEEIPELKPPTEKRFYDGAAMANLRITYQEKQYDSQTFDHGTPPVEIEKLVNKIVSLAKEE